MEHQIQSPKLKLDTQNSTTSSTSSSNPTTPRPVTRPDPNSPYPTTFVQADTNSFKQVVQMLTGSNQPQKQENALKKNTIPLIKPGSNKKPSSGSGSKLYERRNGSKSFKISTALLPGYPTRPEILSPSILDFPSLALSPVTPLIPDPFNRSPVTRPGSGLDMVAEEEAILNKSYFLHPSPGNTPRESEPRLLPLFPLSSPRVAGSS